MKAKITSLLLLLFTVCAVEAQTFTFDGLNYQVTTPNEVQLTGGNPATTDLVIPEIVNDGVNDFTVTSVGNQAFRQSGLTSVDFPTTITTIGEQAFQQNQITNLVLPQNLMSLGLQSFQGNGLVTVTFPVGLPAIGEASFSGNQIATLNIPASVITIEAVAFRNNPLTSLTLSEGLATIGNEAFRINQLTNLTLPSTVTSVGSRAFETNNLSTINSQATTPPTITTGTNDSFGNRGAIDLTIPPASETAYATATWTGFRSVNGVVDFQVGTTFTENNLNYIVTSRTPNEVEITGGTPATNFVIPANVTNGGSTFSVTSVGVDAFENKQLTAVTIPATITTIKEDAFRSNQLVSLTVPEGLISIGDRAFLNNQIANLNLPESLTNIGDLAFLNNLITNLTLPSNITTIGERAFENNSLTAINSLATTPPSITTGTNDTFGNRSTIDLTIPPGSETAYETATWTDFRSVNGVVNFQVGFTFTDNNLDYTVTSLTPNEVQITGGIPATTDLVIPEDVTNNSTTFTVTSVGVAAFRDDQITSVTIPASITSIGNNAFLDTALTAVISNNPTAPTLGGNVFTGTPNNISLTIPSGSEASYDAAGWNASFFSVNGIPVVGAEFDDNGFTYRVSGATPNTLNLRSGDNATGDITISETVTFEGITFNVTEISAEAFRDDQITSVTIPVSVTTIGNNAFRSTALTTVISNNPTAPILGNNVFVSTPSTKTLTIPGGSEASYDAAGWNTNFFSVNGIPVIGREFNDNGFTYRIITASPNELSLRSGNNATGDITIPETVTFEGITFNVTEINGDAFRDNQITSVTIPTSVATIGSNAFNGTALTVVISNNPSAPALGNSAFANTPSAIALTIPSGSEASYDAAGWTSNFLSVNGIPVVDARFNDNGFTYIVTGATPNTLNLRSGNNATGDITIPETVTIDGISFSVITINGDAFRDDQITSVIIPASVVSIGGNAFRDTTLTAVISNNPTAPVLGSNVFLNTPSNIALTIPSGSEASYDAAGWTANFFSVNGIPVLNSTFIFDGLTYIITGVNPNTVAVLNDNDIAGDITIPETVTLDGITFSVTAINANAFRDNSALTSISIPSSVETIGSRAFFNSTLISVTSNNSTAPTLGTDVFENTPSNIALTIPGGSEASYDAAGWNSNFFSVNGIPIVNSIFVFDGLTYRVTGANPNTVAVLNDNDIAGNDIVGDVIIPETVTIDGITLNVTSINANAFRDNSTLTSISIPSGVVTIGDRAFFNSTLTSVTSNNPTAPTLGTDVFESTVFEKDLIIPNGSEASYTTAGWTSNFFTVNGNPVIGTVFQVAEFRYRVTSANPNTLELITNVSATGDITIPETITFINITFTVSAIADNVFRDNTTITSVTVNNPVAPTLGTDTFTGIPANIQLTVPTGSEDSYIAAGWDVDFATINGIPNIGYRFDVNGLTYRITGNNPNTVSVNNGNNASGAVTIPETVSFLGNTLTVTNIGFNAFRDDPLTAVTIPETITVIDEGAFQASGLTDIVIPDSVVDIGKRAFAALPNLTTVTLGRNVTLLRFRSFDSPAITTVTYLSSNPDGISSGALKFGNRDASIDLFIPLGTTQIYLDRGWTDFNSMTEIQVDITLAAKVFLQGAALNPNTGEENLMRDDLRAAGIIPTTSPFGDGVTTTASVFNITGENAIVDWVFIEIRDASNSSLVIEETSALLQRDGDVVDESGVSILKFSLPGDNYFVAVKHRNHLGIMTATPVALLGSRVDVDFTDATNPITFGSNAQTDAGMPANTVGMWAGNVNGDNIVQYLGGTPDTTAILSAALNDPGNFLNFSTFIINGYNDNDVDMSGTTQYEGGVADSPLILQNVLAHPGNFLNFSTFQIIEQLP